MKKCLALFAVAAMSGCNTPAHASDIQDHQKNVIKRTPQIVEVCSEESVSGDKTADTLMGAIIGGAIGQNITKDLLNAKRKKRFSIMLASHYVDVGIMK